MRDGGTGEGAGRLYEPRRATPRDSSRKNIVRGRGSLCARAKDASLLFICEMTFNSDDGEISPWNFFGARGYTRGGPGPGAIISSGA